jgi:1,4-alpha-glucan branching enzyme
MFGHPGKKLLFMGQEFAQLREWSEARSLDWYLLDEPLHKKMQNFVSALNHMYTSYDALYYNDNEVVGFEWIKCENEEDGIVAFIRRGKTAKDQLMFVCNFVPVERNAHLVGAPCLTKYEEILNSDAEEFGGQGRLNGTVTAVNSPCDRMPYAVSLTVPPLSVLVFKYDYVEPKKSDVKKGTDTK